MSDAQLSIHIGADVKEAIAGFNQTGTAAGVLGSRVKDLDQTFEVLNTGLNQSAGYMKQQQTATKALSDAYSQLAIVTKDAGSAQGEAVSSGSKFTASLSQQRVALVDLGRILTGTGFSARSLGSQLTLLPLPILAATGAAIALAYGLIKLQTTQTDAEKAQEKLNQTMAESSASAQGEIAEIKDLTAIIANESNARSERADAFKKLQDQYPNAFKNFSIEKGNIADLIADTNKLTEGLIRQAQIKGLESAITEVYKDLAKLTTESTADVLQGASAWEKLKAAITAAGIAGAVGFKNAATGAALKVIGDGAANSAVQIDALNKKLKELLTTSLQKGDDLLLSSKKDAPDKTNAETLAFLEQTKKALEDIQGITSPMAKKFQQSVEGSLGSINAEILQGKISKAISDGAKDGVSKAHVDDLVNALTGAGDKVANPNLSVPIRMDLQDDSKALDDKLKTVVGRLDKDAFIKVNIDASKVTPELANLNLELGKILSSFETQAIEGLSEAVGDAIGKGSNVLAAAGSELESLIGTALENLGKALITYGVGQDAVQVALTSFNPEVAIAAGILAEVAGAALKSKATHAFATGGIVTGPTLGLVGEAGPEVIFPLGQLDRFMKKNTQGGGMNINVKGKLSGNNLLLLHDRSVKNRNLI